MSFRKEIKLKLSQKKLPEFIELINNKGATELYPKRKISSLYFDNIIKQSHHDSEEGTIPRKKIRIRSYPNEKKRKYLFEKKYSSAEGRFKKSKKISNNYYKQIINNGYFDKMYGILKPILHVEYSREYFLYNNFRITVDQNIKYKVFNKKIIKYDLNPIIEIKFNKKLNEDNIINLFTNKLVRFSKYSNAINTLKL